MADVDHPVLLRVSHPEHFLNVLRKMPEPFLALAQSLLGPLTFDKLSQLVADRRKHQHKLLIGRLNFMAEEFDHAEDFHSGQNRETDGRMQTFPLRSRRPGKVAVMDDVW